MLELIQSFLRIIQFRIALVAYTATSAGAYFQKSVAWHLMSPEPATLADAFLATKSEANKSPEPATLYSASGCCHCDSGARTGNGCFGEVGRYVVQLHVT